MYFGTKDNFDLGIVLTASHNPKEYTGFKMCDIFEFWRKINDFKAKGVLSEEDVKKAHIDEYVVGANYCIHYFYSPLKDRVELMGIDRRYESSIDGLVRVPSKDQLELDIDPSYAYHWKFPSSHKGKSASTSV
nr:unnamed protein product [Methanococcus vannielii]